MSPFRIYKNFLMNPAHHEMASVLMQVVLEITPAPVGCVGKRVIQKEYHASLLMHEVNAIFKT